MNRTNLALFDFDGTITSKDTLFEFCRFKVGNTRFVIGLAFLAPILILQRLKVISAQRAKERFLNYFIGTLPQEKFNGLCQSFADKKIPALVRKGALDTLNQYKTNGTRIIIVSASPENWIKPWANPLGIEVIATRLVVSNGSISGKIDGKNCNGDEKVNRIKNEVNPEHYAIITAYGDSTGDVPMLNLAHQKFFKPFRDKK